VEHIRSQIASIAPSIDPVNGAKRAEAARDSSQEPQPSYYAQLLEGGASSPLHIAHEFSLSCEIQALQTHLSDRHDNSSWKACFQGYLKTAKKNGAPIFWGASEPYIQILLHDAAQTIAATVFAAHNKIAVNVDKVWDQIAARYCRQAPCVFFAVYLQRLLDNAAAAIRGLTKRLTGQPFWDKKFLLAYLTNQHADSNGVFRTRCIRRYKPTIADKIYKGFEALGRNDHPPSCEAKLLLMFVWLGAYLDVTPQVYVDDIAREKPAVVAGVDLFQELRYLCCDAPPTYPWSSETYSVADSMSEEGKTNYEWLNIPSFEKLLTHCGYSFSAYELGDPLALTSSDGSDTDGLTEALGLSPGWGLQELQAGDDDDKSPRPKTPPASSPAPEASSVTAANDNHGRKNSPPPTTRNNRSQENRLDTRRQRERSRSADRHDRARHHGEYRRTERRNEAQNRENRDCDVRRHDDRDLAQYTRSDERDRILG